MFSIGGFIGNTDTEESDNGGGQVHQAMDGFSYQADTAGQKSCHNLQQNEQAVGGNGDSGGF
jgi:hypothetical protein